MAGMAPGAASILLARRHARQAHPYLLTVWLQLSTAPGVAVLDAGNGTGEGASSRAFRRTSLRLHGLPHIAPRDHERRCH